MTQLTFWLLVMLCSSIGYVFMVGYMRRYMIKTIIPEKIEEEHKTANDHYTCVGLPGYTSEGDPKPTSDCCTLCFDRAWAHVKRYNEACITWIWPAWLVKAFFLKIHKAGAGFEE